LRRALTRILAALVLFLLAAGAGYFLSSSLGRGILRGEAERQLAKLMRSPVAVEQIRLRLRLGIEIEANNLMVYPGRYGPGLSARHATARVDLLSLLLGRPRLRRLTLDRAQIRIERLAQGRWGPPPLEKLIERGRERRAEMESQDTLEQHLAIFRGIESATRALMERARVADRIEVRRGSITFIDAEELRGDGRPLVFRLRHIEGSIDHHWLSARAELHLRATFEDDRDRSAQIEARGERRPGGDLRLSLTATGFELATLDPYLARIGRPISVTGELGGSLVFETTEPDHGSLELDWSLREVAAELPTRRGGMQLESPLSQLRSRLEFDPDRLRLARAELAGARLKLELSGVVERPLHNSSLARLSADLRGTGLDEVRRIVDSLPQSDREALSELLRRVEAGRVAAVGGSGAARVSQWLRLLQGDLSDLPTAFVLTAELADLVVVVDSGGRLSDFGASVEWSGDRIEMRGGHGLWKGEALPELDLAIEGVSKLLAASRVARTLEPGAEPLPGVAILWDFARGDPDEEEPGAAPSIQIGIDALHHPALIWPLENTLVALEPIPRGLQVSISEGSWGGAPIRGEALYLRQPEPVVHATIEVSSPRLQETPEEPPAEEEKEPALAAAEEEEEPGGEEREEEVASPVEGRWAAGRFQVSPTQPDQLPFASLFGGFEFTGGTLSLSGLQVDLGPSGLLQGYGRLELDRSEEVPIEMALQLEEGDLAAIAEALSMPPKIVSGELSLRARLSGSLLAGQPLLTGLTGNASLSARDGTLGRELPLLMALAQATASFNPFSREAIRFEAIEATLDLDRGRVATDDFELEGPVRMLLSGWADYGRPSREVDGILGVFLFRQWDQVLGNLPLVKSFLPGSDKGLVGAYFEIGGEVGEPKLTSLPAKSLADELPNVLSTPLEVIRSLFMTKKPKSKRWDGPRPGLPESP